MLHAVTSREAAAEEIVVLREDEHDRLREASEVLASAFVDVPTSIVVYGNRSHDGRLRWLRRLFRHRVATCTRYGEPSAILRDGRVVAVSLAYPPGAVVPRAARAFEAALTWTGGVGAGRRMSALDHYQRVHHPAAPHWYLYFTGVAPRWQGHGLGLSLLERTSRLADGDRVFSYLETDRQGLAELYAQRLGYVVTHTGEVAGLGGKLRNWMMMRVGFDRAEAEARADRIDERERR
jgi:GNAT superfamily N-acetyltransferase